MRDSQGGGDCTNVSPPQRGGAVPAPLSERWAEMARQLPRGARPSGRPQSSRSSGRSPNCLEVDLAVNACTGFPETNVLRICSL